MGVIFTIYTRLINACNQEKSWSHIYRQLRSASARFPGGVAGRFCKALNGGFGLGMENGKMPFFL